MRTLRLLPVLLSLAVGHAAFAQENPVSVSFSVDPARAGPGSTVEVRATVSIAEGWHIYGAGETQGIPSKIEAAPTGSAQLSGGMQAPTPDLEEVPYLGKMELLRGQQVFRQKVKLAGDAAGTVSIPVSFSWQACSEGEGGVCLQPAEDEATLEVIVEAGVSEPAMEPVPDFLSGGFGGPSSDPSQAVTATASVYPTRAPPGAWVELRVDVSVAETWHIYATQTEGALPTALELKLPAGLSAPGPLEEPQPKVKVDPNLGPTQIHPAGTVRFVQRVKVGEGAADGALGIEGKLTWQACDPDRCVSGEAPFTLTLDVAKDAPATGVAPPAGGALSSRGQEAARASSPLFLFVASIGLGLAMLLMPCTYPMIPITVSLFSKGKSLPRRQALLRACVYAGGIVISFVLVGALVQVVLGAQGQGALNAFAANAWVNLVIGGIFVYFAFSFFGYYELGLPAPLQRLMQAGTGKRTSDGTVPAWSLFMMGLFFVLTSYTCGAPVVFGLFATAAQDPHPMAVIGATFIFALTVAVPFFALALIPSAMRLMPKSGSWFTVFKAVMGFVELGFAVKFFRGTDLQWDFINLLPRSATLGLWVLMCVAAAVYLHGYLPIRFPHQPDLRQWSPRRYAWGWVFVGLACYFGYGAAGNPLTPAVESFVLPDPEKGDEEGTIVFGLPYYSDLGKLEEIKQAAKASGKPAFLMFTGHYCPNCVQMEKGVLEDEAVKKLLEPAGRVALFIDKQNDPIEGQHKQLMLERYNKSGAIPAFFVIDGDGEILSAQIGNCGTGAFLEFLRAGGL